jgi:hypothetical protein
MRAASSGPCRSRACVSPDSCARRSLCSTCVAYRGHASSANASVACGSCGAHAGAFCAGLYGPNPQTEPPIGQLPPGAKVLIDDGTCPVGQLKQVVGGNTATGQARLRSCVPLP